MCGTVGFRNVSVFYFLNLMILGHLVTSGVDSECKMFDYVGLTNLFDISPNGLYGHQFEKGKC